MGGPLRTMRRLAFDVMRRVGRLRTRGIEVRLAVSDEELREVFRLNYETYVKELGHQEVSGEEASAGILRDPLEANSVYVAAFDRSEVVGMLVLTLPSGPLSIERSLTAEGTARLAPIRARSVEYRRLAVRPAYRRRGLFLRMVDFSLAYILPQGYRYGVMSAIERHVPTYRKLGYNEFDRPFTKGRCTYLPMLASLDDFASPRIEKHEFPLACHAIAGFEEDRNGE